MRPPPNREESAVQAVMNKISPYATDLLRMDHTKVMAAFHRYKLASSPSKRKAIATAICLAVEIHAQLEEEFFYPAMHAFDGPEVDKSHPEHDQMRQSIGQLRAMEPTDPAYDRTLMELMRTVMHHVADEETTLFPDAERLLGDRLGLLGAEITKRRLELMKPHAGEIAASTMRTMPMGSVLMAAGAIAAGSYALRRAIRH
jgi:hemerythrin superfamily protein